MRRQGTKREEFVSWFSWLSVGRYHLAQRSPQAERPASPLLGQDTDEGSQRVGQEGQRRGAMHLSVVVGVVSRYIERP